MLSSISRYRKAISAALQAAVEKVASSADTDLLRPYYGQMQYHLGWLDAQFRPAEHNTAKLLRPTLLLLAYEAAGAWGLANEHPTTYLQRALPAAVAIELMHNFTLIHDDIVDKDEERRHRKTVWKLWGIPHAINTGDGMFALSRLSLWQSLEQGVDGSTAARLAAVLDRAILTVAEGQYLDISFEKRQDVSVAMYLDMIQRKTAALMSAAAEMGAILGTRDEQTITGLRNFGNAIGIAFQVRDDLLGVWASTAELGKTPAGDIYRRKKSLPFLHALEHASSEDRQQLQDIYQQEKAITPRQVEQVLTIFARTQTQEYCHSFLAEQCQRAYTALARVPRASTGPVVSHALDDMEKLVRFVEEAGPAA
ncbi:MAG: polyprenyl synthetase family protein [Ktedonobacteraceae bacterium]|nr:polyprenyl synthetase family protein [Ktedonobacteraceae bacterium]